MKIKMSRGEKIFQVVNYFVLSIIVLVCLYPMWHVAMASFSNSTQLMAHSGFLLKPMGFNMQAYLKVFQNPMILKGYANTLFILIVGVILDLIMTALAAYFFSRKGVMFKKPLMLLILFDSLTEAAKIDGAGHMTILFRIILPLSKAIMAVMVLYYGVSIWNGWFWASTILRDRELYPLQVILREILISNDIQAMNGGAGGDAEAIAQSIKYATIMVATVPILFVYPFLQKYFTSGVMIGAVKE